MNYVDQVSNHNNIFDDFTLTFKRSFVNTNMQHNLNCFCQSHIIVLQGVENIYKGIMQHKLHLWFQK